MQAQPDLDEAYVPGISVDPGPYLAEYAARFDDRLTIRARCSDVRGARFRFDYSVERDGDHVADGWTTHACVSVGDHRPTRVPAWLVEAIAEAEA